MIKKNGPKKSENGIEIIKKTKELSNQQHNENNRQRERKKHHENFSSL